MIVECEVCGAPLNIIGAQSLATCSYCRTTSRVQSMKTTSMHTPQDWQPPPKWAAPPHLRVKFGEHMPFQDDRPPSSAPAAVGISIVVGILGAAGAVVALASGGARHIFEHNINPAASPTLGILDVRNQTHISDRRIGVANGSVTASQVSSSCRGHISAAPDLNIIVGTPITATLTTESPEDLTMLIRGPDGTFRCDDDSGHGQNPLIAGMFATGVSQVWIGTYSGDHTAHYALTVSGLPGGEITGSPFNPASPDPLANALSIDPNGSPRFGTIEVDNLSGVTTHDGITSGTFDAQALGGNCRGWITPNPDFTLSTSVARRVQFTANSTEDLVLVIRTPDGQMHCDDDSGGARNPQLVLPLDPGVIQIWFGTYSHGPQAPYTATITPTQQLHRHRMGGLGNK